MAHDVFISYSSKNKAVADIICNGLENRHIRCWYAPRDITPGDMYGEAIANAIKGTRVFVVVYSNESRTSKPVLQEIELATRAECVIIPFKTTLDTFEGAFDYYLSNIHWIDAVTPPMDHRVSELADVVEHILQSKLTTESQAGKNTAETEQKTEPAHPEPRTTAEREPVTPPDITPPTRQGSADSSDAAARAVEKASKFFHTAKDSLNRAARKREPSGNSTAPVLQRDWRGMEQAPGRADQPTADASANAGQVGSAHAQTKKQECSIRYDYAIPATVTLDQLKTGLQNALHSFKCRKESVDQYQDAFRISAELWQRTKKYKVSLEAQRLDAATVRVTLSTAALTVERRRLGWGLILYGIILAIALFSDGGGRDTLLYSYFTIVPCLAGVAFLYMATRMTSDAFCAELNAKVAEALRSLR